MSNYFAQIVRNTFGLSEGQTIYPSARDAFPPASFESAYSTEVEGEIGPGDFGSDKGGYNQYEQEPGSGEDDRRQDPTTSILPEVRKRISTAVTPRQERESETELQNERDEAADRINVPAIQADDAAAEQNVNIIEEANVADEQAGVPQESQLILPEEKSGALSRDGLFRDDKNRLSNDRTHEDPSSESGQADAPHETSSEIVNEANRSTNHISNLQAEKEIKPREHQELLPAEVPGIEPYDYSNLEKHIKRREGHKVDEVDESRLEAIETTHQPEEKANKQDSAGLLKQKPKSDNVTASKEGKNLLHAERKTAPKGDYLVKEKRRTQKRDQEIPVPEEEVKAESEQGSSIHGKKPNIDRSEESRTSRRELVLPKKGNAEITHKGRRSLGKRDPEGSDSTERGEQSTKVTHQNILKSETGTAESTQFRDPRVSRKVKNTKVSTTDTERKGTTSYHSRNPTQSRTGQDRKSTEITPAQNDKIAELIPTTIGKQPPAARHRTSTGSGARLTIGKLTVEVVEAPRNEPDVRQMDKRSVQPATSSPSKKRNSNLKIQFGLGQL